MGRTHSDDVRTASENPKRDVPEKGSGPVPVGFFRGSANGTFPRPQHFPRAPLGEKLEARVGIEPTMQLLQSRALPLGDPALR